MLHLNIALPKHRDTKSWQIKNLNSNIVKYFIWMNNLSETYQHLTNFKICTSTLSNFTFKHIWAHSHLATPSLWWRAPNSTRYGRTRSRWSRWGTTLQVWQSKLLKGNRCDIDPVLLIQVGDHSWSLKNDILSSPHRPEGPARWER